VLLPWVYSGDMAVQGVFVGLTESELLSIRADTLSAIAGVLRVGASYTVGGRSFTKADLGKLQDTLSEVNYALGLLRETATTSTVPKFRFP
jgi:hypothetical protein